MKEATGSRIGPYAGRSRSRDSAAARPRPRELIEALRSSGATAGGQGTAVQYAHWAPAVLMNGLGRYEEALAAAVEATRERAADLHRHVGAERACRGRRAGPGTSSGRAARLCASASRREASDADWARGIHAHSRALLSEGEAAEQLVPGGRRPPGAHATPAPPRPAHLLYGEWLRREDRRVAARDSTADGVRGWFASIGMEAFAERARGELLGDRARQVRRRTRRDARRPDRPRSSRSRDSPATASRTRRSARSSSSAPAPWSGISGTCSRSSGSPPGGTSRPRCRNSTRA